jgi:AcrR family transcriptional regulator
MAKAGRRLGAASPDASGTKDRMVEAAVGTLKQEGFAGASARAIGRRGGFNPTLIFYHFGSVNDLLLAALDRTSEQRMERYREAVGEVDALPALLQAAGEIYREDLDSGHITVLAEMIAGAAAVPELGPEITARMDPWIRFTEEAIARALQDSPLADIIPVRDAAFAIVSLYLGIELITHLEGDRSRAESLFSLALSLAPAFEGILRPRAAP